MDIRFITMLRTCIGCRISIKAMKELATRHDLRIIHQDLTCRDEQEAANAALEFGTPWPIIHTADFWGALDQLQTTYGILSTPIIIINDQAIPLQGFKSHNLEILTEELEKALGSPA